MTINNKEIDDHDTKLDDLMVYVYDRFKELMKLKGFRSNLADACLPQ
jgi:hypothetical protein